MGTLDPYLLKSNSFELFCTHRWWGHHSIFLIPLIASRSSHPNEPPIETLANIFYFFSSWTICEIMILVFGPEIVFDPEYFHYYLTSFKQNILTMKNNHLANLNTFQLAYLLLHLEY